MMDDRDEKLSPVIRQARDSRFIVSSKIEADIGGDNIGNRSG
jgi:hypothetical protein